MKKIKTLTTHSRLSEAQKKAVTSFGRDVAVLAGAGSGKTSVLVERFFEAVTVHGMEPERILAITFTDRAANQMKERLVRQCAAHGLSDIRVRIENATIGTIHSFCAKLLREHPIEAGLDPFFQVLGQGESEILMDKEIDAVFEEESDNENWIGLLSEFGETEMRSALKKFYAFTRAMTNEPVIFANEKLLAGKAPLKKALEKDCRRLFDETNIENPKSSEKKISEACSGLLEAFAAKNQGSWETLEALGTAAKGLSRQSPKHKEAVEAVQDGVKKYISLCVEELSAPVKAEFVRIFKRFRDNYELHKREKAFCDFEDLLYRAHRLLSGELPAQKKVLKGCRDNFQAIFVDEFQDTSFLQAEIMRLLKKDGNLFIVGDPQQSIYSFRYAQPDVLNSLQAEEKKEWLTLPLMENYRSRPEIISFINRLFGDMLAVPEFQPLAAKKPFSVKKEASIEWLCVTRNKEDVKTLEESRIVEAKALAGRIRELADGGQFAFKDIAVLLRGTTASFIYEKEFAEAGIPFFTVKGRGFYEKKEVSDLLHFLEILENPDSDIALAAVLRSPLVGISDDALFWLAKSVKSDKDTPLWRAFEKWQEISEISDKDRAKLEGFLQLKEKLSKIKDSVRVPVLIREMLSGTQYEAKLLAGDDGVKRFANLRKLLDMAGSLHGQNAMGPADFIRFVRAMSDREALEPEAKIEAEETNAVKISTIHAAKGLEYRCVIVADMGSELEKKSESAWHFSEKNGVGVCLRNPYTSEWAPDATFLEIDEAFSVKALAESKRLLYVAMTRAQEHLILSGSLSEKDKPEASWMKMAESCVESSKESVFSVPVFGPKRSYAPEKKSAKKETPFNLEEIQKRIRPAAHGYEETHDTSVTALVSRELPTEEKRNWENEEVSVMESGEEDEEFTASRRQFGVVFHKCMEWLVRQKPARVPKSFFSHGMMQTLSETQRKEIEASVTELWKGALGAEIRSARESYPELPFIFKTEHGLLRGQIDLIYLNRKNEWVVLDYKTGRAKTAGENGHESYRLQLAFYALIFQKLYGEPPTKGVLYFSKDAKTEEFAYAPEDFKALERQLNVLISKRPFDKMMTGGPTWPK